MYRLHTSCRACGFAAPKAPGIKAQEDERLLPVFNLGVQPLANDFCKDGETRSGYAPLEVMLCPRCQLGQLSVVVDPAILYRHYSYVTSPSEMMRAHFDRLAQDIASESEDKTVLEIGSNDGRLLEVLAGKGYTCVGIDPAENLALEANHRGVHSLVGFFNSEGAQRLPLSDIVIARHVFCHVDNWKDFLNALTIVTLPRSLVAIEVPYAGDMLRNCEFDTVYHEHLSYLSIGSVHALLKDSPWHLHRIIHYPIHGGVLLLLLRRKDYGIPIHPSVSEFKEELTLSSWQQFANTAERHIYALRTEITTLVAAGKTVAGLGASAKSTVWINACGFNRRHIKFIADTTLQKQWTTSPGSNIPIVDEGAILRELPDYVIVFCWNYIEECVIKNSLYLNKGGKLLVPVPRFRVISKDGETV